MQHDFDKQLKNEDIEWFKPFIEIATGSGSYIKTGIKDDLKGVDVVSNGISVQCKIRESFYDYDLCVEIEHEDINGNKWDGWMRHKPNAEILLYGWKNCYRGKDNICLQLDFNKLHNVYINHKENIDSIIRKNKFQSKDNKGRKWWTWCSYLNINKLRKFMPVGHYSKPFKKGIKQ